MKEDGDNNLDKSSGQIIKSLCDEVGITKSELARSDDLIEGIGEHHGLLQGLIETCLKKDYPGYYERIIDITYRFSAGWRRIHNTDANEDVADNLTTTECTCVA